MYLLKRIEDGRFVAKRGMANSYTFDITDIRIFATRKAAELNRCVENEVIVSLEDMMKEKEEITTDMVKFLFSAINFIVDTGKLAEFQMWEAKEAEKKL